MRRRILRRHGEAGSAGITQAQRPGEPVAPDRFPATQQFGGNRRLQHVTRDRIAVDRDVSPNQPGADRICLSAGNHRLSATCTTVKYNLHTARLQRSSTPQLGVEHSGREKEFDAVVFPRCIRMRSSPRCGVGDLRKKKECCFVVHKRESTGEFFRRTPLLRLDQL